MNEAHTGRAYNSINQKVRRPVFLAQGDFPEAFDKRSGHMIQSPNKKNFRPYGKVIEYPNKGAKGKVRNLWHIVHTEPAQTGWRIAYLVLRDQSIGRMECHPESDETFEPVWGRALIFVSTQQELKDIECFSLDKPLIINKGIWHGVVSLTPETEIKICENSFVACLYWKFGFRIRSLEDLSNRSKSITMK